MAELYAFDTRHIDKIGESLRRGATTLRERREGKADREQAQRVEARDQEMHNTRVARIEQLIKTAQLKEFRYTVEAQRRAASEGRNIKMEDAAREFRTNQAATGGMFTTTDPVTGEESSNVDAHDAFAGSSATQQRWMSAEFRMQAQEKQAAEEAEQAAYDRAKAVNRYDQNIAGMVQDGLLSEDDAGVYQSDQEMLGPAAAHKKWAERGKNDRLDKIETQKRVDTVNADAEGVISALGVNSPLIGDWDQLTQDYMNEIIDDKEYRKQRESIKDTSNDAGEHASQVRRFMKDLNVSNKAASAMASIQENGGMPGYIMVLEEIIGADTTDLDMEYKAIEAELKQAQSSDFGTDAALVVQLKARQAELRSEIMVRKRGAWGKILGEDIFADADVTEESGGEAAENAPTPAEIDELAQILIGKTWAEMDEEEKQKMVDYLNKHRGG